MLLVSILLGGLTACLPTVNTNDPVADMLAADYARRASLAVRLATGSGALVAQVCFVGQDGWADLAESGEGVTAEPEIAALLGLQGPGAITYDETTGGVVVKWEDAEIDEGIYGSINLSVRRATESFGVTFSPETTPIDASDPDGPAEVSEEALAVGFTDAIAVVGASACTSSETSAIEVDFSMPETAIINDDGESEEQAIVTIPRPVDEEDEEAPADVVWTRGALWPDAGDFLWTYGAGADRQQVYGYDAAEISGEEWPSQGEGASGWVRDVDVPLTRGTR